MSDLQADITPRARRGLPFAARVQGFLILVMVVGLVLVAQQANKGLYKIGLPLLVLAAFLQIAFGNIPPSAGFGKSIKLLVLTWVIVAAVFALGIWLAPDLIDASRGN
ncbi:MAG: hypothetical protein QOF33_2850 [Thermomicrobiales bacterium]|jgi:hypothetical protein|nr:hypothetical protein [Thermomicrobiales bacterium]MEA2527938.1 hypothetical protein [Thermomicrobiales bacterium]MEA2584765.1 hypothetical protein [Thermomicrobiales bacterium]MEA2595375.1 hypothetical protein [Thermomicrobiales bacterium]